MREIKFKGYYKGTNGIWREDPDFIDVNGKCFDKNWEDIEEDKNYFLVQYTGVKDVNETEIFEGDILRIVSNFELRKDVQNQVVTCEEGCFGTDEWALFELLRNRNRKGEEQTFEVIGNIYLNPELLEE
ncbi:hypothetical protein CBR56_25250 [Bacillus thuringiensis]|uniref:YopX family protein n=1 Tax=Bacillus tropicus TaxID=2026188 RepID=UPI000B6934ED|nr:YopX family protein [Bacillus tropicus]OTX90026.1 hypothetical protein BK728_03150 [Bacillus thuringiensis serovar chanpaisis]PNK23952.1 hypothetical protein CBR56_25250 [Bacillus thuringiensis]